MENLHIAPAGEFMLGREHTTGPECPCKPTRTVVQKPTSSGKGGSHQGYKVVRIEWRHNKIQQADEHGNVIAREGIDRCECGSKYWENDKCHSCGADISKAEKSEA